MVETFERWSRRVPTAALNRDLAWEALKRALRAREIRTESLGQALSGGPNPPVQEGGDQSGHEALLRESGAAILRWRVAPRAVGTSSVVWMNRIGPIGVGTVFRIV